MRPSPRRGLAVNSWVGGNGDPPRVNLVHLAGLTFTRREPCCHCQGEGTIPAEKVEEPEPVVHRDQYGDRIIR